MQGIDCVVGDCPEYAGAVERECGEAERACCGGIGHEDAEIEGEAEECLRIVGDALHEWVGGNEGDDCEAEEDGEDWQGEEDGKAGAEEEGEENQGLAHADFSCGDGARFCAFHLSVDFAVEDVVDDATC